MALANGKGKNKIVLVTITVLLVVLYISCVNPSSSYGPSSTVEQPNMNKDFAPSESIGQKTLLEHGTTTSLGNGLYSYSTVIGERNTFNGSEYVRYLYDDVNHNATFAGHSLTLYDWYAVFANQTQILIDDMRFIVQYWQTQGGGRWGELDLFDHSFLPAVQGTNLRFGQRYTDGGSILDVWYIVTNNDNIKILLNFTAELTRLYRFQWQITGVDGLLQEGNKSLSFDDVNIGWSDTDLNATYDWQVANKKLDISFDSLTINAGNTYTLDPSVNPVIGADSDDDYWNYEAVSHVTGSADVYIRQFTSGYWYIGQQRFSLAIPQGATITSANITCYETFDSKNFDVNIFRIDETDVGSLEADTVFPAGDYSQSGTWAFDGAASEWHTESVTNLVQTQVNLGGWSSGYYIGLRYNTTQNGNGQSRFEDYQAAGTNHAYMNVTYSTGGSQESITVYELLPLSDSTSTVMNLALTIFEIVSIAGVVTTKYAGSIIIYELLPFFGSVSTIFSGSITINEIIGLFDSMTSTIIAGGSYSVTIYDIINLSGTPTTIFNCVVTISEVIDLFGSVIANINPSLEVVIYAVIPIGESVTSTGGMEGLNILYDLFMSANMWSILGPMFIVVVGYLAASKNKGLGVIWFLCECLFSAWYFDFANVDPFYYWHGFILILGGVLTLIPALMSNRR